MKEGERILKGKRGNNYKGERGKQTHECAHRDVLKGDYSSRFLVGRELEVVQAVVVEDEPSSLPTLVPKKTIFLNEIHPRSQQD